MRFSMHVPLGEIEGGFQTMAGVATIAKAVEAAGADAANVTDHPVPDSVWLHANGHDAPDPFTALAFVAAHTTSLYLHTNIVVLPYRNPFITAKAAATLQVLSDGRLIMGVGVGYQRIEFDALGVDFTRRGVLMDEALDVLGPAWAGGPVTLSGSGFEAVAVEPRPAPNPAPRLWIGGGSAKAVERAARFGDGWSPFLSSATMSAVNRNAAVSSIDELGREIKRLEERRAELGREGPFDVVLDLGGQQHPKEQSQAEAQRFGELVEQVESIGVTWICLKPMATDVEQYADTVGWYGEEVMAPFAKTNRESGAGSKA